MSLLEHITTTMHVCRYIFWLDWGRDVIERASMDGTERTVIVSEGLTNPLSIALDYSTQTLYWIDVPGKLGSSSFSGSNQQTLLVSPTQLFNTVGMVYYSNVLFWTERQDNGIYSAPVSPLGQAQELVSGLSYEPYQLRIVHHLAQPPGLSFKCVFSLNPVIMYYKGTGSHFIQDVTQYNPVCL